MAIFMSIWMLLTLAGITFLLVYGGLRLASWLKKSAETADESPQEATPMRPRKQTMVSVLLGLSGILPLCGFPASIVVSIIVLPYAVFLATLILFATCLIRYIRAKRTQKRCLQEISQKEMKFHIICVIVSAVLFVVALAILLCLLFLPSGDVAYM